jgi:hypothetical protein
MPQISAGDTVGVNGFVYTYYERLKEVQELPDLLLASVPIALAISALAYDETVDSAIAARMCHLPGACPR